MAADTAEEPLLPQSEENTMAQPRNWQRKTLARPLEPATVASCPPHTRFSVEDWQLRILNTKYAGNNTLQLYKVQFIVTFWILQKQYST